MTISSYADIEGWFDFDALYERMVVESSSDSRSTFVEVGCWKGKSLCFMAEKIKEYERDIRLIGVDHGYGSAEQQEGLRGGHVIGELLDNLNTLQLRGKATLIVGASVESAALFADGSIDFCFIDASHDYKNVMADIEAWWSKIKHGGTMAGHDYKIGKQGGVVRAVDEFFGKRRLSVGCASKCWIVKSQ